MNCRGFWLQHFKLKYKATYQKYQTWVTKLCLFDLCLVVLSVYKQNTQSHNLCLYLFTNEFLLDGRRLATHYYMTPSWKTATTKKKNPKQSSLTKNVNSDMVISWRERKKTVKTVVRQWWVMLMHSIRVKNHKSDTAKILIIVVNTEHSIWIKPNGFLEK